jgi:hypothetical protein
MPNVDGAGNVSGRHRNRTVEAEVRFTCWCSCCQKACRMPMTESGAVAGSHGGCSAGEKRALLLKCMSAECVTEA